MLSSAYSDYHEV